MSHPSDESLLSAFRTGDRSALGDLARRYERPLLGLATGLLDGKTDMAADAIQETWLRVIRFADKFDGRSSFKTWLYRIAINQCRTIKSRSRPTTNSSLDASNSSLDASIPHASMPSSSVLSTQSSSLSISTDPDHLSWLRSQVSLLSPDKRTVLLLCYHEGITHQLAAEILDVPLGTLKSRLHAALTTLRAAMAEKAPA